MSRSGKHNINPFLIYGILPFNAVVLTFDQIVPLPGLLNDKAEHPERLSDFLQIFSSMGFCQTSWCRAGSGRRRIDVAIDRVEDLLIRLRRY